MPMLQPHKDGLREIRLRGRVRNHWSGIYLMLELSDGKTEVYDSHTLPILYQLKDRHRILALWEEQKQLESRLELLQDEIEKLQATKKTVIYDKRPEDFKREDQIDKEDKARQTARQAKMDRATKAKAKREAEDAAATTRSSSSSRWYIRTSMVILRNPSGIIGFIT